MNTLLSIFLSMAPSSADAPPADSHDLVVYGGTSGGIAAAIQAKRMGKSVVLIEPTQRLGGLTTNGLGQTDIGNKAAIGGISREFYVRVAKHYADPDAWKWQKREQYRSGGQSRTAEGEEAMWTFEPSVALKIYQDMLREAEIPVVLGERIDRKAGVTKDGTRITAIRMESGRTFQGTIFIDATYEGDLLAGAGVSYTVGREANARYDETLNGVQTRNARSHQILDGVDPYVEKGNSESGLLPGIDPTGPGEEGSGDQRVQAYCFRMCITDAPENRIPFHKPEGFNELDYELLFRNFEAGLTRTPWKFDAMPNRKTDINNNLGVSTDYIGQNYDFPEGDYETRDAIFARHLRYQQGLMWVLANHPRVPEKVRAEVSRWGKCKDEFTETGGWPAQLYVREARRMIGEYVMTQHNCQGRRIVEDPVGLAAYTMDSHNVQRYVTEKGFARNEGDVQVGGFSPYPISYRSLTPKASECENLLVPVALSASHIAFGSIRMEPVFMVLGQSAATAGCQAIDSNTTVQKIDPDKFQERLLADKQILKWTGPVRKPIVGLELSKLAGVVVDDQDAQRKGFESVSNSIGPFVQSGYRHDGDEAKGDQSIRFVPELKQAGTYEVRLVYSPNPNRATNVPVMVRHADGTTMKSIDQRKRPPIDGTFVSVGRFRFEAGKDGWVEISNAGTNGHVIADAVQWIPIMEE